MCFCIYRRLIALNEEEEDGNCKTGPKPVRFVGPSTSTQIKVKNSASIRVSPASALQAWSQAMANQCPGRSTAQRSASSKTPSLVGTGLPGHSPASHGTRSAENGATDPPPAEVLLSDKKATPHRVVKLKRTPLCAPGPSPPACTAVRPEGVPEPPPHEAPTMGVRTKNEQGKADWWKRWAQRFWLLPELPPCLLRISGTVCWCSWGENLMFLFRISMGKIDCVK